MTDPQAQTQRSGGDPILAMPTLVRQRPHPVRKIIGDGSATQRGRVGLNLRRAG